MDEDDIKIPQSAYDLIELLSQTYPHECIRPGQSLEEAHRYSGARQLIDELVELKAAEIEAERSRIADQSLDT